MSLSLNQLKAIINELNLVLPSAIVQDVYYSTPELFNLILYKEKQTFDLLISLENNRLRCHLTNIKRSPIVPQPNFALYLRKHFLGIRFINSQVLEWKKNIKLTFEKKTDIFSLIINLSNNKDKSISYLDYADMILYSTSNINHFNYPYKYEPPIFEQSETYLEKETIISNPQNILFNYAVDSYYTTNYETKKNVDDKTKFVSFISNEIKAINKYINKLESDIEDSKNYLSIQQSGELIKASLHLINKGDKIFTTPNYFSEDITEISITLNEKLSPIDNAKAYFKKAKKLKNSKFHLSKQLHLMNEKLTLLNQLISDLQSIVSDKDLLSLLEKYKSHNSLLGIITKWKRQNNQIVQSPKEKKNVEGLRYLSISNDIKIFVGRNSSESMKITFSIAKGNDIWLHAYNYHGTHVVIKKPKAINVDPIILEQAAQIALFFSKGKNSGSGEVMWTYAKHVNKPKGEKEGKVFVSKFKVINVTLDMDLMNQLKESFIYS